jgi:hypothetical protein
VDSEDWRWVNRNKEDEAWVNIPEDLLQRKEGNRLEIIINIPILTYGQTTQNTEKRGGT